jgi:hypothetical protein
MVAEDRVKTFQLLIGNKADKRPFVVAAKGRKVLPQRVIDESFRLWLNEDQSLATTTAVKAQS